MADLRDFDRTPANNTSLDGISSDQNATQTAQVDDLIRSLMAASAPGTDWGDANPAVKLDHIAESTADAGVTIDGLKIKDGGLPELGLSTISPIVSVSANDTTTDYLQGKLSASGAASLSVTNEGGDETLDINVPEVTPTDPLSLCQAWVSFNGNNGNIEDSYGVSSVTRNGSGDYSITFESAFANAFYSFGHAITQTSGGQQSPTLKLHSRSTTVLRVRTQNNSGSNSDVTTCVINVFGRRP